MAIFTLNTDCFSQCPTFTLNPCTTSQVDPCPVKAFGASAKVVKHQSNPSIFWVRLSAGGFGYISSPPSQRPEINVGVEVNSSSGYTLARKSEPPSSCATVFGSCIQAANASDGSSMTVTPVATSQIGDPFATGYCRKGPSISITLNASDTALIDTGMVGPSTCDIRPSTEVGEPINIGSGNVYRNEVDAVINSGKIGAFSFERNYNSLNGQLSSFGYGWQ
ncbi:MAG: DUF6531 domain-containing protein, partial [candidate division Zixibacteria bacterium]|nr:DUF6531 domain-containing protein [candidate division Zixibacteria bacterium]